jgi:hypothetical protein
MPRNRGELQQEKKMTALPSTNFLRSKGWSFAKARFAAAGLCCLFLILPVASAMAEVQLGRDITRLPPQVQRMRQAILQAAVTGDIEQLRVPIEMNEIHPVFAKSHIPDPIAYLKSVSADGNGREMLAILFNILTAGYAIANPGTKDEMIVWPYHAVIPLNALTPSQEVEIYRFLPPARLKEMIAQGKYKFYSAGIGPDGVWHYFSSE